MRGPPTRSDRAIKKLQTGRWRRAPIPQPRGSPPGSSISAPERLDCARSGAKPRCAFAASRYSCGPRCAIGVAKPTHGADRSTAPAAFARVPGPAESEAVGPGRPANARCRPPAGCRTNAVREAVWPVAVRDFREALRAFAVRRQACLRGAVRRPDRRTTPTVTTGLYDRQTAVYDISAHAVYLPNGTILEAHSTITTARRSALRQRKESRRHSARHL